MSQNTGGTAGTIAAEHTDDDPAAAALAALSGGGGEPPQDGVPATGKRRKSRSGTSGAERARRAKAAGGATTTTTTRAPRTRAKPRPNIATGMTQLYVMLGMGVTMAPSPLAVAGPHKGTATVTTVVGMELVAQSASIGAAWEQAAKDDPRIREALEKLLTVSTFGLILAAHLPVVMAGLVAAGTVAPEAVGMAGAPATGERAA